MSYTKKDYEKYLEIVKDFNEEKWVQHQLLLQEKPNVWFILEYGEKSVSTHEERTSRMFRWLLDPNETHNLGNIFAHKLFRLIGVDYTYQLGRNAEVKATAEEKRIDVLYKDLSQNIILAIEVKQYAREGEKDGVSQLEGYEQSVNKMIASKGDKITGHYIYLTPLKEKATKSHWIPVGYEEFIQIIEEVQAEYLATSRDKYINDTKKIIGDFKDDLQRSIDILKKEGKELNNKLTKQEKKLTRQLVTEIQEEMNSTHMDKLMEINSDKDLDLKNTILIMAEYIQKQNHTTNVGAQMLIRKIYNYLAANNELVTDEDKIETYKIGETLAPFKQSLIDTYKLPYTSLAVTSGDGQGLYIYHEDKTHQAYFSGDADGNFPNDRVQLIAPRAEEKLAARSTSFNGEKFIIEQKMIEADTIKTRDGKVVSFKELMEEYILVQIKQLSEQVAKKNLNNTSSNVVLEKENSQKPRYLTKSRFTVAMECPTKLFYTGKKEYVNNSLEDPFLEALAEGGFQVGELATAYYPGGKNIETLDYEQSLQETNELLKQENCVIYEAAIKYENLFVRVDILQKIGNRLKLIEVKAKSTDSRTDDVFYKKDGDFQVGWKQYVYDVAFQTYVAEKAFPTYEIMPYLMLVDKNAKSPTDGLNQKFKITKDENGRKSIILAETLTEADLAQELLVKINMEKTYEKIRYEDTFTYMKQQIAFPELIKNYAAMYEQDKRINPIISSVCKNCEFKANEAELNAGMKSGYHECFKTVLKWEDKDFKEDNIFNLWDCRRTDKLLQEDKIKFADLSKDDIGFKESDKPGLSRTERQWMQIEKSLNHDTTFYLDKVNLKNEMEKWTYPLHFIDFETSSPAIPFNKGRRPYEGIAFQFSHHIVHEDGSIEHKSEYLNTKPGVNPNYQFIRKLKSVLDNDQGTIFKYSPHENTYLNMIYQQLQADVELIADRDELCAFIREITEYNLDGKKVEGPRNMVDLYKLVKDYYYDPYMKGSNSIKVVLPAVLNSSRYLQEKYSKPIYGAKDGIKSLNFNNWTWIQFVDGQVVDPYQLLPKIFDDITDEDYEYLNLHEDINNGGAAMTAYERLQFEDVSDEVRNEVEQAMLKYCELDTLAMVMIYEAWADMVK